MREGFSQKHNQKGVAWTRVDNASQEGNKDKRNVNCRRKKSPNPFWNSHDVENIFSTRENSESQERASGSIQQFKACKECLLEHCWVRRRAIDQAEEDVDSRLDEFQVNHEKGPYLLKSLQGPKEEGVVLIRWSS